MMGDASTSARPASLTIRLGFHHPTMDPGLITAGLRLKPTRQVKAGDQIVGIDGHKRRNVEPETRWTLSEKYYDFSPDQDSPDVSSRLRTFLDPLMREPSFVRQLAAEGSAWIELNFPGQFHLGCVIRPEVLRMIADLDMELGLEVFPDSAT
jgi:hypothetical protein